MRLDEYYGKLKRNTLTCKEYSHFKNQSLRLVKKACRRYSMDSIVLSPSVKDEIYGNIYIKSLLKMLNTFDESKSTYSTYFYYKALSAARVEAGKATRRIHTNNTLPLLEGRNQHTQEQGE